MKDALATPLRAALRTIAVPLAHVLQRFGVSYSQFCRVMLEGYIEAAQDSLTVAGEKPTHSRIALLSGVTRQKIATAVVSRMRSEKPVPKVLIIYTWWTHPRYRGKDGKPIELPFKGPGSFSQLVKSCTSAFGPRTALDEFEAMKIVEVRPDGMVRLLHGAVIPLDEIEFAATGLRNIGRHLSTIKHNLGADPTEAIFERFTWSWRLPASRSTQAIRELKRVAQRFTSEAEQVLDGLESEFEFEQHTVGLGSYIFYQPKD